MTSSISNYDWKLFDQYELLEGIESVCVSGNDLQKQIFESMSGNNLFGNHYPWCNFFRTCNFVNQDQAFQNKKKRFRALFIAFEITLQYIYIKDNMTM